MTESSNVSDTQPAGDDEISLLDLLIVLAKYKKLVLGFPFVVAVLAAGISLLITPIFTATTTILPPLKNQSSASAILGQLGGVAGLVGGAPKGPNDLYVAMLQSRTVADKLIERFGLMKSLDVKYPSVARRILAGATKITANTDGTITIVFKDEDPKRAADVANAYVDELLKLTRVLAVTEASQRRLFFERQFNQAKDNLTKAEIAARQALERNGLMKVDDQGRAMVEASARLRAEIAVKQVQIGAMRTFAADRNPDLLFAQQELESLRRELGKIEGTNGDKSAMNGQSDQGIKSLHLLRDVKYYETMYTLLAKQFELAKLDEAKDNSVVQVMDKAIEPDQRSWPKRKLIVLLSALVALFVGIVLAFFLEAVSRTKNDPQQAARLQALKRYLAWR